MRCTIAFGFVALLLGNFFFVHIRRQNAIGWQRVQSKAAHVQFLRIERQGLTLCQVLCKCTRLVRTVPNPEHVVLFGDVCVLVDVTP